MLWNVEDFRKLCQEKEIGDTTTYQNTLHWKIALVNFHAEKSQNVWDELYNKLNEGKKSISINDPEWGEAEFASEAHTVAAAHALHSMADIMAQIVNIVVINGRFSEGQVTMKKILKHLDDNSIAPQIKIVIEHLLNSSEFRYIDAFVNTIKHRNLIDTNWGLEYGEGKRNEAGVRFKEFKYNGYLYPLTWTSQIVHDYKTKIIELVLNIGIELNKYLA